MKYPISMKVTVSFVLKHFPYLSGLLNEAEIGGKKKLTLKICFTKVDLGALNDGECRFTSGGKIDGPASFAHLAGSTDSAANRPIELVSSMSGIQDEVVNKGYFYAILDVHEFYGMRHLTIFFNPETFGEFSQELKNQLVPLQLKAPAYAVCLYRG
jgi:hypothetical protein